MTVAYEYGVDGGHGPNTAGKRTPKIPELGGRQIKEFEFNNPTAKYLKVALERCGQKVTMLYNENEDTPLTTRTKKADARNVRAVISIHFDALDGEFNGLTKDPQGFTVFYQTGSVKGSTLAKNVATEMAKGTKQQNRGAKASNLHMTREPSAPSILCECGFMDFKTEAMLMLNVAFQKETAEDICRGLSKTDGFTYVAPTVVKTPVARPDVIAKPSGVDTTKGIGMGVVIKETILRKEAAYKEGSQIRDLKVGETYYVYGEAGTFYSLGGSYASKEHIKFTPHPKPAPIPVKEAFFRVRKTWADDKTQKGAFKDLEGAKELVDKTPGYKVFNEAGKVVYEKSEVVTPTPAPVAPKPPYPAPVAPYPAPVAPKPAPVAPKPAPIAPKPTVNKPSVAYSIMGDSNVATKDMVAFVQAENPEFDPEIALQFILVGDKYGIRGDIAFCQALIETGWFKYVGGTAVTPDQHNYCGLGVTSKGMKGHSFATVELGVTAHIQHLYAYATKAELPKGETLIDPRFKYVSRGIAPTWHDLSNKWAMNEVYGEKILAAYDRLLQMV